VRLVVLLAVSVFPLVPHAAGRAADTVPHIQRSLPSPEDLVARSLVSIGDGRMRDAMREVETALQVDPQFRLAHLIRGDLLLARTRALERFGDAPRGPASRLQALREEARARLERHRLQLEAQLLPRYLLRLDAAQKYAVVVDASKSTLYLYHNDGVRLRYVSDFYVTLGRTGVDKLLEGDKRTPIGVYRIVRQLTRQRLSDFYGSGAWPIDYPNAWDRGLGRKGHGIWLHGTPPGTYSRAPRASDGCVVLSNRDLDELGRWLQPGLTPVVIASVAQWAPAGEIEALRDELELRVEGWRQAWDAGDAAVYGAHYGPSPGAGRRAVRSFTARRTARGTMQLSELSIVLHPGPEDLAVVSFLQDHPKQGHTKRVRQYWQRQAGEWRIVQEGPA
jgi:L,D-peptidoglycan transpeptidase YkuD (ErfK/YbiS/YcfS/YnhG family)